MDSVILVIHLILALAIIGLVLLQRSEGGGLGIGGGGGGLGGLASPKGTANFLTRATALCAAAFFCTSLALGILAGRESGLRHSVIDSLDQPAVVGTLEDDTDVVIPSVPLNEPTEINNADTAASPATDVQTEPAVPIAE